MRALSNDAYKDLQPLTKTVESRPHCGRLSDACGNGGFTALSPRLRAVSCCAIRLGVWGICVPIRAYGASKNCMAIETGCAAASVVVAASVGSPLAPSV